MSLNPSAGPGRPKGSTNKATRDVRDMVDRVFKAAGGEEKIVESFLNSDNEEIRFRMMIRLQEYRYGKPKESSDVTVNLVGQLAERLDKALKRTSE